jgi:hypothetical protein
MLTSLTTNIILSSIKLYFILSLLFRICNAHSSYGNGMNLLLKIFLAPDSGVVTNLIECLILTCKVLRIRSENSLKHNTCGLTLLHVVKVEGVLKAILRIGFTCRALNIIIINHVEGRLILNEAYAVPFSTSLEPLPPPFTKSLLLEQLAVIAAITANPKKCLILIIEVILLFIVEYSIIIYYYCSAFISS